MNKSIVEFNWIVDSDFSYPKDSQFYCTGYTGKDGSDDLFSIVVRLIDFKGDAKAINKAEVFALSEDMESFLPKKGERFYFTSGEKVVAEGVAIKRTF